MTEAVLLTEHPASNQRRIGRITLNTPKNLNALSLDMIDQIAPALKTWEADPQICCVWLEGSGDRAFCAGGDIRALYEGMTGQRSADFCQLFFTREYRMDFHIHNYSKPLICWADGIVMGGGLGMMSGAGYRVVTERSRISMPEISIGLYPDVAGTWFLNRMPAGLGMFLALTGAALNANDARCLGLADRFLRSDQREQLFNRLLESQWGTDTDSYHQQVNHCLSVLEAQALEAMPQSQVLPHLSLINDLLAVPDMAERVNAILALQSDDPWLQRAQQMLAAGSPLAAAIIQQQLQRGRYLSLAEVYRSELALSMYCSEAGEFAEGVRALLIDKDGQPQWRYPRIEDVDPQALAELFQPRWSPDQHPLADL